MTASLETTFRLLATGTGEAAAAVLAHALTVPAEAVQAAAVAAVIRRGDPRLQMQIVDRWPTLCESARLAVTEAGPSLTRAIRQCLTQGTAEAHENALQVVRAGAMVAHLPTLVEFLCHDDPPPDLLVDTFRHLSDRLHESLRETSAGGASHQATIVRSDLMAALERYSAMFGRVPAGPLLVETTLAFGTASDSAVRSLFHPSDLARRELALAALRESRHPGVMAAAFDLLGEKYPHASVVEIIRERQDPEFVAALLRWLPEKLTEVQTENLRQVGDVAWLDDPPQRLTELPGALQRPLLRFMPLADIAGDVQDAVRDWVLRFGEPEARAVALRELGQLPAESVRAAITEGLESEDARVQAWALSEARSSRLPDAMPRLLSALDSAAPEVVDAARSELSSFNLTWLLANLEQITPAEGERAGRLLRKINPNVAAELAAELRHPIRQHRVRAAYAARLLKLQRNVLPALLQLLDDEEIPVRRVAVDVVADVPTAAVRAALESHADDPSVRVREAIAAALGRLSQSLPGGTAPKGAAPAGRDAGREAMP